MDAARPNPDLRDLLSHAAWLRQLVAPLLGGEAAIDDVLQETWVAALERPPRDTSRLRGWLARVAWRIANRDRRESRRRVAREARAATPEFVPAAHRVAAEVELEAKLAALVLALEPRYRDAILLRFYDGLPPRAIAVELSAPVATVKTWLRRGLEQLRAAIATDFGPEWRGALAPLALTGTIAAPIASASSTAFTGSLLANFMNIKLIVSLAACSVLCGLLWFALSDETNSSARSGPLENASAAAPAETERIGNNAATVDSVPNVRRDEMVANPEAAASGQPPREFLVEVLNHDGTMRRDVDVGLSISYRDQFGRPQRRGHGSHGQVNPEEEEARIRIPASLVSEAFAEAVRIAQTGDQPGHFELAIECMLRGIDCERHVLKSATPPDKPIRLRIGAVGTVVVDVLDIAGSMLSDVVQVELRISPPETAPNQPFDPRLTLAKASEQGQATFRFVPVGRKLEARIWDHSPAALAVEPVQVAGPLRAGEEVRIALQVTGESTRLIGRLVDDSDAPLADRRVRLDVFEGPRLVLFELHTDAEGRFEMRWDSSALSEIRPDRFEIALLDERGRKEENSKARILAPPIPAMGTVDLGTITIALPKLIAAGIVVDENGEALANASISLFAVWPIPPRGDAEENRPLDGASATTDDEGRFEIRSAERVRGLRVATAMRSFFEPEPIYAEPGRTDLRLVLHRGLALEGNVLLDDGVPPRTIQAEYFGASPRRRGFARVGSDFRFSFASLLPGSGSVVLNFHGAIPLLRVDGIEIGRDSARAPERLRDLDLRGKIRAMTVRCIEANDAPLARTRIELADPLAPQHRFPAELDADGRARLWLPNSWESFWLVVEGYAPVSLTWLAEERVVRLDSAIRIALELAPDVALQDGFTLSVAIGFPKSSALTVLEKLAVPQLPHVISRQQPTQLSLPVAGNYAIYWTLRSGASARELRFATTQIHVQSARSEQTLRVAPPAGDLERALAEFR